MELKFHRFVTGTATDIKNLKIFSSTNLLPLVAGPVGGCERHRGRKGCIREWRKGWRSMSSHGVRRDWSVHPWKRNWSDAKHVV